MTTPETIYLPISADLEIQLTMQVRYYSGISSDPRTLTRPPSVSELLQVVAKIRDYTLQADYKSTLDYPEL